MRTIEPEAATHSDRLKELYNHAGTFQIALDDIVRHAPNALLTEEQARHFNEYLTLARALLPDSIALKEDVEEADTYTPVSEAAHGLRVTIEPTLHNALPENEQI